MTILKRKEKSKKGREVGHKVKRARNTDRQQKVWPSIIIKSDSFIYLEPYCMCVCRLWSRAWLAWLWPALEWWTPRWRKCSSKSLRRTSLWTTVTLVRLHFFSLHSTSPPAGWVTWGFPSVCRHEELTWGQLTGEAVSGIRGSGWTSAWDRTLAAQWEVWGWAE